MTQRGRGHREAGRTGISSASTEAGTKHLLAFRVEISSDGSDEDRGLLSIGRNVS